MRSSHSRIRVVRAAVALPEITPEAASVVKPGNQPLFETREELDRRTVRTRQDEIDKLCKAEYNKGLADGRGSMASQLESDYASRLLEERSRIDAIVNDIREQFSALYGSMEGAVVKFAFGVAERIIRREVSLDRSIVLGQINESVRRVLGVERLTIRVHPDDLTAVREQKGVIQANGDSIREIIVESDEGLEPGDCVLESDMGNIDARLSTQLKQIENMLFESKVVS